MRVAPVPMELTMTQRQAATKKRALAYRAADRAGKSRILTELEELIKWHCDKPARCCGRPQGSVSRRCCAF